MEKEGKNYGIHVYRVALVMVLRLNKIQYRFSGWFHFHLMFYRNNC